MFFLGMVFIKMSKVYLILMFTTLFNNKKLIEDGVIWINQIIYASLRNSSVVFETKYSRTDQVKFVEDSL